MQSNPSATPFQFQGKAGTLERLASAITTARVLPMLRFTVAHWRRSPQLILERCKQQFGDQNLIIRSSCRSEDQKHTSAAGVYKSIPHVRGDLSLKSAIERVINSYGDTTGVDEVLVQPMARGVLASGVAMTRDPETGLPYYVVDYVQSDTTDDVTSGHSSVHSLVALKSKLSAEPEVLRGLFALMRELEQLTQHPALDIEFAISVDGPLLFQVRPMVWSSLNSPVLPSENTLYALLKSETMELKRFARAIQRPDHSTTAFLGLMPDWNPAEMIGVKPRPLAYSLYKHLITDRNWASARFRYGYRDVRHKQLMHQFCGSPYICIPFSIESFLPAALPSPVAYRIVERCSDYLANHQALHDKLEFAVVPTCFTPTLALSADEHVPALDELNDSDRSLYLTELKRITELIISADGPFFSDLEKLPDIRHRVDQLTRDVEPSDPLHILRRAIADAHAVAELFSGIARAAFVATALVKSLEKLRRVPDHFADSLIGGIATIGRKIAGDFNSLEKSDFLRIHGHVRPGTYDIRVCRYDEATSAYFDWSDKPPCRHDEGAATAPGEAISLAVQQALHESGFAIRAEDFFSFVTAAVSAREEVKYLYSAFVSQALQAIAQWGTQHKICREDLSFTTLDDFLQTPEAPTTESIRQVITTRKARWQSTQCLRAPAMICRSEDFLSHVITSSIPNFITRYAAEAPTFVVNMTEGSESNYDLTGRIVLIENADPGFDWIFTRRIAGFITAYGGENSHMSIRAREFSIPAAIGLGEAKFRSLLKSQRLLLDCAERRIQVLA